ncbi:cysteine--1-D-myo-inosityl 2-amino-2-deoxy-alpha-D-glucopyranoside ligase [Frondihabitans sp. PAMC 28766]|uniref:cysteine--1-D-myo-inosityl 2-amino-2-deoxy-alpha-D-glucopyranoside ligase n=1 Tax=Frondihabitans sp. PAMC 28766 TaxID=1795630 RepID=UPI00078C831B|nr:cysteine--1-D-myo-inosityl 2-amino-2-deoxy-alpha-D-glucopyranoside ligase [Frondihabitans sp. PAMC 28766]AMM20796.1 cysteine--1-D-myo-inosityl 2-amino-2-deoxy-alpha-D-glucopyranoside ligase [Frondihabitans sp. PAMC 28766]
MRSWATPSVPSLPGVGAIPTLYDTATGDARPTDVTNGAQLYVCGITPYDATHLGHANTYLAFDTLNRVWRDAGVEVAYAQNTTDVDDPLLERAAATNVDWRELAESQTDLFRSDMQHLRVIPPDHYIAVTDMVSPIGEAVAVLLEAGFAYRVETLDSSAGDDVYFDVDRAARDTSWHLGIESRLDAATMMHFFSERGGDPDRIGKRNELDPLLWRSARDGEPSWPGAAGSGRPGWHIECTVIARDHLTLPLSVQGGGSDLVFPHHEMSAGHATALTGEPFASHYAHAGMVAYQGEKMSKSLGNLVKVSELIASEIDPRAIRLALLSHHYRSDWEWFDDDVYGAIARLSHWAEWAAGAVAGTASTSLLDGLRAALADDLDTPAAVALVETAVQSGATPTTVDVDAVDALLGIPLR